MHDPTIPGPGPGGTCPLGTETAGVGFGRRTEPLPALRAPRPRIPHRPGPRRTQGGRDSGKGTLSQYGSERRPRALSDPAQGRRAAASRKRRLITRAVLAGAVLVAASGCANSTFTRLGF